MAEPTFLISFGEYKADRGEDVDDGEEDYCKNKLEEGYHFFYVLILSVLILICFLFYMLLIIYVWFWYLFG